MDFELARGHGFHCTLYCYDQRHFAVVARKSIAEPMPGLAPLIPLADELRDPSIRFRQRRFVWQEDDAEVLRSWLLSET